MVVGFRFHDTPTYAVHQYDTAYQCMGDDRRCGRKLYPWQGKLSQRLFGNWPVFRGSHDGYSLKRLTCTLTMSFGTTNAELMKLPDTGGTASGFRATATAI